MYAGAQGVFDRRRNWRCERCKRLIRYFGVCTARDWCGICERRHLRNSYSHVRRCASHNGSFRLLDANSWRVILEMLCGSEKGFRKWWYKMKSGWKYCWEYHLPIWIQIHWTKSIGVRTLQAWGRNMNPFWTLWGLDIKSVEVARSINERGNWKCWEDIQASRIMDATIIELIVAFLPIYCIFLESTQAARAIEE